MNDIIRVFILFGMSATFLFLPPSLLAYKQDTHKAISLHAATSAGCFLSNEDNLRNIGLLYSGSDARQSFKNSNGDPRTINVLIQDGANFEDNNLRAANHFFNPLTNEALTGVPLNKTSPDWALEDGGDITVNIAGSQEYSYKDARQYFYEALTTVDKTDRALKWGKAFETLGHVIHHIQDMAQPQHVRNDMHLDNPWIGYPTGSYNPSLYEDYTDQNRVTAIAMADASPYPVPSLGYYSTPRTLWTNWRGDGLAQFTNANFLSAGTNFDTSTFSSPAFNAALTTVMDIQNLCASASPPCANPSLTGMITFYGNYVEDKYTGQTTYNPYASSESIFTADLATYTPAVTKVYSLNRFNFDLAQVFLIPRAVAYSAGLINYFFRGRMEISLPDEKVYGVVDHSVENQKDTGGFHTIKLKLKNVTSSGTDTSGHPITDPTSTAGTLVAVAKFHRNTCYQPDLSGEYGSPGMDWHACRSKDEDIVVSNPATVPLNGIDSEPQSINFTFQVAIPINASDLYLQVVYRGPLGQESDAVAVATSDISEPTFIGFYNDVEHFLYGGYPNLVTFQVWCGSTPYDQCKYRDRASIYIRFALPDNFDPANPITSFNAPVAYENIAVSQYARVAILTDPGNISRYSLHADPGIGFVATQYDVDTIAAMNNQFDKNANNLFPALYDQIDGFFVDDWSYQSMIHAGDLAPQPWPNANPLTPLPATINFQ